MAKALAFLYRKWHLSLSRGNSSVPFCLRQLLFVFFFGHFSTPSTSHFILQLGYTCFVVTTCCFLIGIYQLDRLKQQGLVCFLSCLTDCHYNIRLFQAQFAFSSSHMHHNSSSGSVVRSTCWKVSSLDSGQMPRLLHLQGRLPYMERHALRVPLPPSNDA